MVPLWIMPPPPCEASWSAEWAAMVTNVEKDNDYSEAEDGPEEYTVTMCARFCAHWQLRLRDTTISAATRAFVEEQLETGEAIAATYPANTQAAVSLRLLGYLAKAG